MDVWKKNAATRTSQKFLFNKIYNIYIYLDVAFNSIEDRLLKSPIVKPLDLNEVMKLNLNQIDAAKVESEADSDQQEWWAKWSCH